MSASPERRAAAPVKASRFAVQRVAGRGWGIELVDDAGNPVMSRLGFATVDAALAELQRIIDAARSPRVFIMSGMRPSRPGE